MTRQKYERAAKTPVPASPPAAVPDASVPTRPTTPRIVRRKGVNSNYYLARILEKGIDNLTAAETRDLALLVKESHRIKPVSTTRAGAGKTVFNSVTGHHEWLPTDRAEHIIKSTVVWTGFYTSLRSPTWLLMVTPARYCENTDDYGHCIEAAAGYARGKTGKKVLASRLGLVGHSGGLSYKGTQLTMHQSTWHNELRDLYDKHAPSNNYDGYWYDLQQFINDTFLFVSSPTLPVGNADLNGVQIDDLMKSIEWDLQLSGRGNPQEFKNPTMYDVAQYLHSEWGTWGTQLKNSFVAWRNS
jgi:hypothetical protein